MHSSVLYHLWSCTYHRLFAFVRLTLIFCAFLFHVFMRGLLLFYMICRWSWPVCFEDDSQHCRKVRHHRRFCHCLSVHARNISHVAKVQYTPLHGLHLPVHWVVAVKSSWIVIILKSLFQALVTQPHAATHRKINKWKKHRHGSIVCIWHRKRK